MRLILIRWVTFVCVISAHNQSGDIHKFYHIFTNMNNKLHYFVPVPRPTESTLSLNKASPCWVGSTTDEVSLNMHVSVHALIVWVWLTTPIIYYVDDWACLNVRNNNNSEISSLLLHTLRWSPCRASGLLRAGYPHCRVPHRRHS